MRKSQHQLRDEVNQAEASLRKEMSDQTKLHETVFRRVMAACLERPYMRHSLDPDETIYLQVSLESRVFRDIVEAGRTACSSAKSSAAFSTSWQLCWRLRLRASANNWQKLLDRLRNVL
jgi:hypothetical protein